MKKIICFALSLTSLLLLMAATANAAECSGSWRVLPNYKPGSGGACRILGLDTNQPVCRQGERYATYCDDASGGRYRICQSNIPCAQNRRYHDRDYRWDDHRDSWRYDRHYRRDYRWDDRHYRRDHRWDDRDYRRDYRRDGRNYWQGTPDKRYNSDLYRSQSCMYWDYNANRPCAPGTINRDCQKGCDGRE